MKILVTGFEAFGGESINPALEIIKQLPQKISGADVVTLELPTAFNESRELLERSFEDIRPDAVISIGQAGGRSKMTVEKIGINLQDAPIEDNRGFKPLGRKIYADGADGYFSNLPVKRIAADMNAAGVPAEVSYSAGTFVCNSVLYTIMYNINTRYPNMKGGFVHVPFLPVQATDKRNAPSMSLNDMVKAITTVIEVVAENRPEIDGDGGITN